MEGSVCDCIVSVVDDELSGLNVCCSDIEVTTRYLCCRRRRCCGEERSAPLNDQLWINNGCLSYANIQSNQLDGVVPTLRKLGHLTITIFI